MPLKLIYSADLHGNNEIWKMLLNKSEREKTDAVVIGTKNLNNIGYFELD